MPSLDLVVMPDVHEYCAVLACHQRIGGSFGGQIQIHEADLASIASEDLIAPGERGCENLTAEADTQHRQASLGELLDKDVLPVYPWQIFVGAVGAACNQDSVEFENVFGKLAIGSPKILCAKALPL